MRSIDARAWGLPHGWRIRLRTLECLDRPFAWSIDTPKVYGRGSSIASGCERTVEAREEAVRTASRRLAREEDQAE